MNRTLVVLCATGLVCGMAEAQAVPVAGGSPEWAGLDKMEWPTVDEIGVPLYPDLTAFLAGENVGVTEAEGEFRFVNFASQADVATLLAWYGEHAEGWVVDETMEMLFPEGASINDALMGQTPYVNISDMVEGTEGKCGGWYACKTMVQVVYKPAP